MPAQSSHSHKTVFDRFLDTLSQLCIVISGIALVFLTIIFGWLVFGRYVLNSTPTWVEQASLLLIVLIGFLGASAGIHKNTHLGVSFFRDVSPRPVQRLFEFVSNLALLAFSAVMMVYGYKLMIFKWGTDIPLLHLPEGLRAVPVVICGACTSLFSIGHLVRFFKGESQSLTSDE